MDLSGKIRVLGLCGNIALNSVAVWLVGLKWLTKFTAVISCSRKSYRKLGVNFNCSFSIASSLKIKIYFTTRFGAAVLFLQKP
jgi:hypothetical protein